MISRRTLFAGSVALLAERRAAGAQPAPGIHRIGYLTPFSVTGTFANAFREGLRARVRRGRLKTARALGVTIPQSLLLRADQVIEESGGVHPG